MKAYSANELLELQLTKPLPIWGPIHTHNLILIYGPRGVAKSRFSWKLVHTMAAGGLFLNHGCEGGVKVGIADGELGLTACQSRFLEIEQTSPFSVQGDNFKFFSYEQCNPQIMWNLSDPSDQAKYDYVFKDCGVIVIDNLLSCSRAMSNRDSDFDQWQRIQSWAFKQRSAGKTIIFIHHTAKSGDQFGTSTKENCMDLVVSLKAGRDPFSVTGAQFELHYTKYRDVLASDVPPLSVACVKTEDGSFWNWSPLSQSLEDKLLALKAAGLSKRDAAKELCLSLYEVSNHWREDA